MYNEVAVEGEEKKRKKKRCSASLNWCASCALVGNLLPSWLKLTGPDYGTVVTIFRISSLARCGCRLNEAALSKGDKVSVGRCGLLHETPCCNSSSVASHCRFVGLWLFVNRFLILPIIGIFLAVGRCEWNLAVYLKDFSITFTSSL